MPCYSFSRWPQKDSSIQPLAPLLGCKVRQAFRKCDSVHWGLVVDQKLPVNRMPDRNCFRTLPSLDAQAFVAFDLTQVQQDGRAQEPEAQDLFTSRASEMWNKFGYTFSNSVRLIGIEADRQLVDVFVDRHNDHIAQKC